MCKPQSCQNTQSQQCAKQIVRSSLNMKYKNQEKSYTYYTSAIQKDRLRISMGNTFPPTTGTNPNNKADKAIK